MVATLDYTQHMSKVGTRGPREPCAVNPRHVYSTARKVKLHCYALASIKIVAVVCETVDIQLHTCLINEALLIDNLHVQQLFH